MTSPSPLPASRQAADAQAPMMAVGWAEHARQLDPQARGRLATGAAAAISDRQYEYCLVIEHA